ncbi:MAG: hypothetical protein ACTSRW_01230 [Candidatus Helarchaeota archaeon]
MSSNGFFSSIKQIPSKILEHFENASRTVSEHLYLSYGISAAVGTALFFIIMPIFGWNFNIFLILPAFLVLTLISGATMKFLSGLGISITFATVTIIFFRIFSKQMKKRKKLATRLKVVFMILGFLLIIYGIYNIITGLSFLPIDLLDRFISLIFGMFSLILFVFIIPLIQDEYRPFEKYSKMDKIKAKFGSYKYTLWKGYKSRIKKDYGIVNAAEYERLRAEIEDFRDKISGFLLLPLSFTLPLFLPLLGIAFILWFRIFSIKEKPYIMGERILLLCVMAGLLIIGTILFLFVTTPFLMPTFKISYAVGIFSSMIIFNYIIYKS